MADMDGLVLIKHFHMSTFPRKGHSVTYYEKSAGVLRVLCEAEKQVPSISRKDGLRGVAVRCLARKLNASGRYPAHIFRIDTCGERIQWILAKENAELFCEVGLCPPQSSYEGSKSGQAPKSVTFRGSLRCVCFLSANDFVYTPTHLRKRQERAHATLLFVENPLKDKGEAQTAELTGCISFGEPESERVPLRVPYVQSTRETIMVEGTSN
ncbi:hypothetical protein H4582DRAFT_2132981 [Lactarius indigo]|nr:hypothetical protein H4582DRAFT_2132981 [Lactarius indigo]